MCDASNTLPSSALSSTILLIPGNIFPYLSLGLVFASFIAYSLHYHCPSARLGRLNDTFTIVGELLDHAKADCRRDYLALAEIETRFLRTKLTASRLHTRLLKARGMPSWKDYLKTMMAVPRSLPTLRRELREVHTSLLLSVCQGGLEFSVNLNMRFELGLEELTAEMVASNRSQQKGDLLSLDLSVPRVIVIGLNFYLESFGGMSYSSRLVTSLPGMSNIYGEHFAAYGNALAALIALHQETPIKTSESGFRPDSSVLGGHKSKANPTKERENMMLEVLVHYVGNF
ncbi:hypothetical protein K438DRAFT_1756741 [Mycena galopus ATCC 62051]|nr:hypothetical protein K438DRAFT_1756741 [Mycena galopus ATCC 62051]